MLSFLSCAAGTFQESALDLKSAVARLSALRLKLSFHDSRLIMMTLSASDFIAKKPIQKTIEKW